MPLPPLDPRHTAVLVIDMQRDFLDPEAPVETLGGGRDSGKPAARRTPEPGVSPRRRPRALRVQVRRRGMTSLAIRSTWSGWYR